jgi:(p)ppGpp synthase/HD superfamily hydrolase
MASRTGDEVAPPLVIKGTEGMAVKFAKCCWPLPYEHIVGLLAESEGLTVHQAHCPRVKQSTRFGEKIVDVAWASELDGYFQAGLKAEVYNQMGILGVLGTAIAQAGANIDKVNSEDKDGGSYSVVTFILSVRDRKQLARVMRGIRNHKAVTKVARFISA